MPRLFKVKFIHKELLFKLLKCNPPPPPLTSDREFGRIYIVRHVVKEIRCHYAVLCLKNIQFNIQPSFKILSDSIIILKICHILATYHILFNTPGVIPRHKYREVLDIPRKLWEILALLYSCQLF